MRRELHLGIACVVFCACAGNCGPGFESQSQVTRLRVLGVQAEPADIIWDFDKDPQLVRLTALAVDPDGGGRAIDSTFRYCPPLTEPPTYTEVSDFPPVIGPTELDCPSDSAPTLPSAGPLSATFDALTAVRNWPHRSVLDGGLPGAPIPPGGVSVFEALALYRAGFDVSAGSERVRGYKQLLLAINTPPNKNPVVEGLQIDGEQVLDSPLKCVGEGHAHVLQAIAPAESFEPFGDAGTFETLRFSFHATAGNLELHSTETLDGGPSHDDRFAEWNAPTDDPFNGVKVPPEGEEVTFWVVARDDRGGTGWNHFRVLVKPECSAPAAADGGDGGK